MNIRLFSAALLSAAFCAAASAAVPVTVETAGRTLDAQLEENATARALLSKMPFTVSMFNAHEIEMVHRFEEALPAEEEGRSGYKTGDLFYWTPKHAFVIYYGQNGKSFDHLQKVGHIEGDVSFFKDLKEADVTFKRK